MRSTPSKTAAPRVAALVALVAILAAAPGAFAQEYHVDLDADNQVTFISRASIEEFEGVTDRIDGYVLLDGPELTAETGGDDTEFYLEVDLASLDTGIGLRNRHMRDNYLEVEQYPYASYDGHIFRVERASGDAYQVVGRGTLSIHGVDRAREIVCTVSPDGEGYRSECSFQVLLSDHDIEIPKVMFLKLSNEIRLELSFRVQPAGEGQ